MLVKSVYECCYGSPSELMLIASICDKDEEPVKQRLNDIHRQRALGIKRAVTDCEGLAGIPTLELVKNRCWNVFEDLAKEPAENHKTFYGWRINKSSQSPILQTAHATRSAMSQLNGNSH